MTLQVTVVEGSSPTTVVLAGELDVSTAPVLLDEAGAACAPDEALVLDCSGLTFLDSSGLGAVVALRRRCQEAGGSVRLVDVPGKIEFVLTVAGLDALLL